MRDAVDCGVFEDQLDAGLAEELPVETAGRLWAHAAACSPCRALLGLRSLVPGPSLANLEARVPDEWIDEMEPAVRRALVRPPTSARRSDAGRPRGSKVPLLVAAVVALLISTGLAVLELDRSRERGDALAAQLLDQQRRIAQLETSSTLVAASGPSSSSRESWLQVLGDRPSLTVAELRDLLEQFPDDVALLGPARTRALAGSRWVPSPWREAFETLPSDAGATAGDLRNALDLIGLPEDATVPTRRLLDLLG